LGLPSYIFNKWMGWRVKGGFDPSIKKSVVIVVPHTANFDFIIGLFARRLSQTRINYLGKKELFRWPFGWYFRWTGGVPLDRTPGQNKVEAIAEIFNKYPEFRLALAPEGTRKKVEKWKTGFYYIAKSANVPLIPVAFDYGTKTVTIHPAYYISGSIEKDLPELEAIYKDVKGKADL